MADYHVLQRLRLRTVETADGCWEWTGAKGGIGYGQVKIGGRKYITHRLAWEAVHGPVPEGMWVLHHCDNPPCIRPSHLWLGTFRDNNDDRIRKGRSARGSDNGGAKLTEKEVHAIKTRASQGLRHHVLAAAYGVSASHISKIVTRRKWAHLAD